MPGYLPKPPFPLLNRGNPLFNGLLYSWHFGDGSGTKLSESVKGSINGSLNSGCSWQGSAWGSGVLFDDTTGAIDTGLDLDFERTDPFSVSVLLYLTADGDIVSKLGPNPFPGWVIFSQAGQIGFYLLANVFDPVGRIRQLTAGTYLNQWIFITCTYDGSSTVGGMHTYINGVDVSNASSGTLTYSILNNNNLFLGNRTANVSPLGGTIAGVNIWNRELSADEATALAYDPFAIYRPSRLIFLPVADTGLTPGPYSISPFQTNPFPIGAFV